MNNTKRKTKDMNKHRAASIKRLRKTLQTRLRDGLGFFVENATLAELQFLHQVMNSWQTTHSDNGYFLIGAAFAFELTSIYENWLQCPENLRTKVKKYIRTLEKGEAQ